MIPFVSGPVFLFTENTVTSSTLSFTVHWQESVHCALMVLVFHFHRWGSWPGVWTQMLRHGSTSKTSVMVSSPWKVRMSSNVWSPEYAAHGVGYGVALFGHVTAHSCHCYLQVILAPVTMPCCLFIVSNLHDREKILSTSEPNCGMFH